MTTRKSARKRAQRKYRITPDSRCERCGISRRETILTRNHKDGDTFNNEDDNIEILCFPCHAETDMDAGLWGWSQL